MVESKIYIGLNDVNTNTQLFENEKYVRVLRNVCYSYRVPFSFHVQEGGYIYENGEYARETSLVVTLIDVEKGCRRRYCQRPVRVLPPGVCPGYRKPDTGVFYP